MKSLRYAISKKTPHNFDDLIDYCTDKWFNEKPLPDKAVISVKAYKNQADKPLTGTEHVFIAEYLFHEKDRVFSFSAYAGLSATGNLSDGEKNIAKKLNVLVLKTFGIECVLANSELENLLKK